MTQDIKEIYKQIYQPLWEKFMNGIKDVEIENCPEPHLPIYGEEYIKSEYKIAFVGIDTIGSCGMANYKGMNGFLEIIDYWKEEEGFDEFVFCEWEKKHKFWKFIFEFLSQFYDVNVEELKKNGSDKEELEKILKSFVWANANSIERFHITAQNKGVKYENWKQVKDASLIFDDVENILNVFKPKILILLNWTNVPDEWFPDDRGEPEIIDPNSLWHYFIENTQTHLYWTKHPRSLVKVGFDKVIYTILQSIKDQNIFQSFPGEQSLEKYKEKFTTLEQLREKIETVAKNLDLKVDFDKGYALGKNCSGFWFYKEGWKYCIYFYFNADLDDLLIGIDQKDNDDKCDENEKNKIKDGFKDFKIIKKINGVGDWMWVERFIPWDNTAWTDVLSKLPSDIQDWCKKILEKLNELGLG